eukprot:s64_g39.t1
MLERKRPGYFSGCCSESKWAGARKRFKWDLFAEMMPRQAAICDEVPSWLKGRLGCTDAKFKGPRQQVIPEELLQIADAILLEECKRGLEMDAKSVHGILNGLVAIYNEEATQFNQDSEKRHLERVAELKEGGQLSAQELEAIANAPPSLFEPKRKVLWKNGEEGRLPCFSGKGFARRKKIANALAGHFGKSAECPEHLVQEGQLSDKEVKDINESLEGTVHVEYTSKKTHMWNGETCVKFFEWVSKEIRRKRKSLGYTNAEDAPVLAICDRAPSHQSQVFQDMRMKWAQENNVILLGADKDGPCVVPGGFGATMQPNDRFHQFFHLLRATFLRAACGVPANPLASSLAEKELGPHNIPVIQCPLRVSLEADAFAISRLREYRGGSIIQWAWVTTGHVTEEELASWRYGDDREALEENMAVGRGGFKELLQMTEAPEVDHSGCAEDPHLDGAVGTAEPEEMEELEGCMEGDPGEVVDESDEEEALFHDDIESLAIATCSAPERLAEKMVERLQQSCLSEANLGKTVCIWEETLPGGSRKGFSFLVAQAFAIQVKAVGFSSVEWWGGKEFKDTGGKYLVNPIPMYDKYTVKLRVRWVDEAPPRPPLNQGPSGTREGRGEGRGEGPIVAMMKEEVYELQKQLLLQAQAQTKVAQQELRCALRRAERAEQDTRWIAAPLGFSPRREA